MAQAKTLTAADIEQLLNYIIKRKYAARNRSIDLPPACRTKVMEQSPLISENSGHETFQIYR